MILQTIIAKVIFTNNIQFQLHIFTAKTFEMKFYHKEKHLPIALKLKSACENEQNYMQNFLEFSYFVNHTKYSKNNNVHFVTKASSVWRTSSGWI